MNRKREFLKDIKLLEEKKEFYGDISFSVMKRIQQERKAFLWKLTFLLFPVSIFGTLTFIWIFLKLHILHYIVSFTLFPAFVYRMPFVYSILYIISVAFFVSFALSVVIQGGVSDEMLLSSR